MCRSVICCNSICRATLEEWVLLELLVYRYVVLCMRSDFHMLFMHRYPIQAPCCTETYCLFIFTMVHLVCRPTLFWSGNSFCPQSPIRVSTAAEQPRLIQYQLTDSYCSLSTRCAAGALALTLWAIFISSFFSILLYCLYSYTVPTDTKMLLFGVLLVE